MLSKSLINHVSTNCIVFLMLTKESFIAGLHQPVSLIYLFLCDSAQLLKHINERFGSSGGHVPSCLTLLDLCLPPLCVYRWTYPRPRPRIKPSCDFDIRLPGRDSPLIDWRMQEVLEDVVVWAF